MKTFKKLISLGYTNQLLKPKAKFVNYTCTVRSFALFIFFVMFSLTPFAQFPLVEDAHPFTDSVPKVNAFSYFGGPHTPRGELKVLVLTIGFDGVYNPETNSIVTFPDQNNVWPVHSPLGNDYQGFPKNFDEIYYSSNEMFSPEANDLSISNYYYQHSRTGANEPFKVTYEFFPYRINVPVFLSDTTDTYFSNLVNRAYDTIQMRYANFNWQQYDVRTNSNFQFDNSINPTPDGNIDYLLILFRSGNGSAPNTTLYKWINKIPQNGLAGVVNRTITTNTGATISFNKGFTMQTGLVDRKSLRSVFIHEDGHVLCKLPHVFGSNAVVGNYFYTGSGWSHMNSVYGAYYSQNAWERWWFGWLNIKYELNSIQDNGEYLISDFVTTGEAMRIKIPVPRSQFSGFGNGNQYIWIEYRTGQTIFDKRLSFSFDGSQNPIPPASNGVVAFIEDIFDDRGLVGNSITDGANGLKTINPNGNFDYSWTGFRAGINAPEWWGNRIYNYTKEQANPFGAHNSTMSLRDDYYGESLTSPPNGVIGVDPNWNLPPKIKREQFDVIELDNQLFYGSIGYDIGFPSGKKISISTNPGLIGNQKYNAVIQHLEPIYLHGLSFTVIGYEGVGVNRKARVKVKFDDFEIHNNIRWCGNIILSAGVPLVLKASVELLLDKSGTPNRHILNTAGDFINPTVLTFKPDATFTMDSLSMFRVTRGSSLTLENGSKLSIDKGAMLVIEAGSTLSIENCAEIEALSDGQIVAKDGAILKLLPMPF